MKECTPSYAFYKSEAKALQKAATAGEPWALACLAPIGIRDRKSVTRMSCFKAVARGLKKDEREIAFNEQLIAKYARFNVLKEYWSSPYEGWYTQRRFQLQFDAIVHALRDGVPLAQAAALRCIDFEKFHFSSLLFSRVSMVIRVRKLPSYNNLQAPGSLIDMTWFQGVENMQRMNLRGAKFYGVLCDPAIQPGAHCYNADFSGSDLRDVDFRCSYLRGSSFIGTNLQGADFRNANIYQCNFTGAKGQFIAGEVDPEDWIVEPRSKHKP